MCIELSVPPSPKPVNGFCLGFVSEARRMCQLLVEPVVLSIYFLISVQNAGRGTVVYDPHRFVVTSRHDLRSEYVANNISSSSNLSAKAPSYSGPLSSL